MTGEALTQMAMKLWPRKQMAMKFWLALLMAVPVGVAAQSSGGTLAGAWSPETYVLEDGSELPVSGLIFFTESDWTVLFFVQDGDGAPQRGSAEGGSYTLDGDALTFRHAFHLSAGSAIGGLSEAPLRMSVRDAADAPSEPCRIELDNERLTIHFPSGNRMGFARSSR